MSKNDASTYLPVNPRFKFFRNLKTLYIMQLYFVSRTRVLSYILIRKVTRARLTNKRRLADHFDSFPIDCALFIDSIIRISFTESRLTRGINI